MLLAAFSMGIAGTSVSSADWTLELHPWFTKSDTPNQVVRDGFLTMSSIPERMMGLTRQLVAIVTERDNSGVNDRLNLLIGPNPAKLTSTILHL